MIDDFSFLEKNQKRIEKALNKSLPAKDFSNITEAIHYSVLDGGKRIRPQLIYLVADSLNLNIKDESIDAMAASGELIHSYSLIHDDLELMILIYLLKPRLKLLVFFQKPADPLEW